MKLLLAVPNEGPPPLYAFLTSLDEKQRQKLYSLFALLLQLPDKHLQIQVAFRFH